MTRTRILIASGIGLATIIASVALLRPLGSASAGSVVDRISSPVTIDSIVGERFTPPPADAAPALDAEVAWKMYATLNGSTITAIPKGVTVQLGLLTLPVGAVGPDSTYVYTAKDELAYGYSSHSCPISMLGTPPSDTPCVEWLFLDADTGQQIDDTWQR